MRFWVTRAEPGATATGARLKALGHEALVAPVIGIVPVEGARIDLAGVGALAFTSANGVQAFAGLSAMRGLPVYAVGDATAEAAKAAGFSEVVSADGDVAALAVLIAARRGDWAGAVLHPSAAKPAGELAGALAAAGVEARTVPVYDIRVAEALSAAVAEALAAGALDGVLIHSPSAARATAALLPPEAAERLAAFALSQACAAPLAALGFRLLEVAPFPRDEALLKLAR